MKSKLTTFIILILICFSFCLAAEDSDRVVFPHSRHVEERACTDCHKPHTNSTEPALPDTAICSECHDDSPEKRVNPRGRIGTASCFIFSHGVHQKSECQVCHLLTENDPPKIPEYIVCMECHSLIGRKTGCSDCHSMPFTPEYHKGLWRKSHGDPAGIVSDNRIHGRNCGSCHPDPTCIRCHQSMKPQSHTGFFRLRGHGLAAAVETTSCRTCHRESFCIQCHRETQPLNHRGAWSSTHGYAIPGGITGSIGKCGVCHKTTWCQACHNR